MCCTGCTVTYVSGSVEIISSLFIYGHLCRFLYILSCACVCVCVCVCVHKFKLTESLKWACALMSRAFVSPTMPLKSSSISRYSSSVTGVTFLSGWQGGGDGSGAALAQAIVHKSRTTPLAKMFSMSP